MTHYLFVCSGNICRSPMALYLARAIIADPTVVVSTAGTMARDGQPPTDAAAQVMAEIGIDITAHRSRDLWSLDLSDVTVLALADQHRVAIALRRPAARVLMLDPSGGSIPDPYGGDIHTYRRTRDQVRAAVLARFATGLSEDQTDRLPPR